MTKAKTLVRAARLDAEGIYLGMDELPEDKLTEHHLPQITDCDLPEGQYRWSAEQKAFIAVGPPESRLEPNALAALHAGFRAVEKSGVTLPKVTKEWLDWYETTWDGQ